MYYPISLDVKEKTALIVGGGAVAERKAETLLSYGAKLRLVSPKLSSGLAEMVSTGTVEHRARPYRSEDLEGCALVFACADRPEANEIVSAEAKAAGIPVNVADRPSRCTFFVPAVLRRGDLTVAVSTQGKSPALARRLRDELAQVIGLEYEQYLTLLGDFRVKIKGKYPDQERRLQAYDRFLDSDVLELLRAGRLEAAREKVAECT